jgi:hypothetical protein
MLSLLKIFGKKAIMIKSSLIRLVLTIIEEKVVRNTSNHILTLKLLILNTVINFSTIISVWIIYRFASIIIR